MYADEDNWLTNIETGVMIHTATRSRFRVWSTNGSYRPGDFAAEALSPYPIGLMEEAIEVFRFESIDRFSPLTTDDIVERREAQMLDRMAKGEDP